MTAMQCDRARQLMSAYRDGELALDDRRNVADHVATCKSCTDMLSDDERIASAVRRLGRTCAPPALAGRISMALDRIDAQVMAVAPAHVAEPRAYPATHRHMSWLHQAAAAVVVALLSGFATWWLFSQSTQSDQLEREVLAAHVRSLLQDTTVQVASSDQQTVKPWFAGRADFAPDIKNLANEGFPLAGGRLDYVSERRVAVAVYKRHLHIVNVFMWPAASGSDAGPRLVIRNGYNLLSWSRNGVSYWAASDLNGAELRELQRLL